jgi:zinc/manganese transport system permease protein
VHRIVTWVFEPGFFSSQPVHIALTIGASAAVVSAVVGVFTVLRGQSFAGHALTDVSAAGGSGAVLVGVSPFVGFVGLGVVGAGVMDMIGVQRVRGRDLATGIVLGASIGLAALFLYFDTTSGAASGATQQILFGSIFTIGADTIPAVVVFGAISLGIMAMIFRPLLLISVDSDLASAQGVPTRIVGFLFMMALAVSVGLSSLAIGAILSTALLVGPAATALRLSTRIGWTVLIACVIGVGTTWAGVVLAYDSYDWGRSHQAIPVSFMVVALNLLLYGVSGVASARSRRKGRAHPQPNVGTSAAADSHRCAS